MTTQVTINWRLYYKEFSRVHGGSPVIYRQNKELRKGGYLLFRDGWMYSINDPSGPEYKPKDKKDAKKKITDYWLIREAIIAQELRVLKDRITGLMSEQSMRSAPLMTVEVVITEDEDGRKSKQRRAVPVDFELLLDKADDMMEELRDCRRQLRDIRVPLEWAESDTFKGNGHGAKV